ncbi:MAG: hypothetical protein EXR07_15555 [Acetobacteraceae bacterium]|nr:hypothetical protein [Acetobacteraceae bacterium]
MQRRHLLNALAVPMLASGCALLPSPDGPAVQAPAGALLADPSYPAIGAKWRVRVTERGFFRETVEERDITAASVEFNGRRGYGLVTPVTTTVLDPASFNTMGSIEGGKVTVSCSPGEGPLSRPLWVGKVSDATYSLTDFSYGQTWNGARSRSRVTAFEDVTVPAGTFNAFRIEYDGGIGTSVDGGRGGRFYSPGIETKEVYWYAPGPKIVVKSVVSRLGSHHSGTGTTTTELVRAPA